MQSRTRVRILAGQQNGLIIYMEAAFGFAWLPLQLLLLLLMLLLLLLTAKLINVPSKWRQAVQPKKPTERVRDRARC